MTLNQTPKIGGRRERGQKGHDAAGAQGTENYAAAKASGANTALNEREGRWNGRVEREVASSAVQPKATANVRDATLSLLREEAKTSLGRGNRAQK